MCSYMPPPNLCRWHGRFSEGDRLGVTAWGNALEGPRRVLMDVGLSRGGLSPEITRYRPPYGL
jgi:hypothetical protein